MCCKVFLFVAMLLRNWAIIWMPLLIFPYVLSLVSQMQLEPLVNLIPSTDCLFVRPSACGPARLDLQWRRQWTVNGHIKHGWSSTDAAHCKHNIQTGGDIRTHATRHQQGLGVKEQAKSAAVKRQPPPLRSFSGSSQAVMMLTMATRQDRLLVFILLIPPFSPAPHASLPFLLTIGVFLSPLWLVSG